MNAAIIATLSTLAPILTILANGWVRHLDRSLPTVVTDEQAAEAPMRA